MRRREPAHRPPTVVWRDTGTGVVPEIVVPSADGYGWHKEPVRGRAQLGRECRYCRHETTGKRCETCGGPE